MPDDKITAISIAALRQYLSAGPGRDETKSMMQWVPTRCQLADGLTKHGLAHVMRELLSCGKVFLHERSAKEVRFAKNSSQARCSSANRDIEIKKDL